MAEVSDDQLAAWAGEVNLAAGWVSGTHRKRLNALCAQITAARSEPAPAPEAPSLASGLEDDVVDDEQ